MPKPNASETKEFKKEINRYYFIIIFLVTNALAYFLVPLYINPYTENVKSSSGNNIGFPIFYIALIVVFSIFFIFMARLKRISILKTIIYIFIAYSLFIILLFDLSILSTIPEVIFSGMITAILLYYTIKGKSLSLTVLGIILGSGIALILSSIFYFEITIIIGAIFSIYDALSVVLVGNMVEMAETALDNKIPLLFSYGEEESKVAMGFGDVIIPTFVLFSIYTTFGLIPYLIGLTFACLSFIPINFLANKSPQPGLPFIINFIFLGLILYLL